VGTTVTEDRRDRTREGLDVVKDMEKVATGARGGHQDVPREDLIIEKVTVEETVEE